MIKVSFEEGAPINRFPREIFKDLPSLQILHLGSICLAQLTPEDLSEANHLNELKISGNPISHIPANVFSQARELKKLYLSDNQIQSIDAGAFTSPTLKHLDLSENLLASLTRETFSGAENLERIFLEGNSIQTFEEKTFHLLNLEQIDLSDNGLKTLPDYLFQDAPKLTDLSLEDNEFERIMSVVEKASALSSLDLSNNRKLKETILLELHRLPSLTALFLANVNRALPKTQPEVNDMRSDKLTTLSLANNGLNDRDLLSQLKGFKNLELLYITGNRFGELNNFDEIKNHFSHIQTVWGKNNGWSPAWMNLSRQVCNEKGIDCDWLD